MSNNKFYRSNKLLKMINFNYVLHTSSSGKKRIKDWELREQTNSGVKNVFQKYTHKSGEDSIWPPKICEKLKNTQINPKSDQKS